jgi:hypothetical protein
LTKPGEKALCNSLKFKTMRNLLTFLFFCAFVWQTHAQLPKIKLPIGGKDKKTTNQSTNNQSQNNNNSGQSNSNNASSGSNSGSLSQPEQEAMYNFYQNFTAECDSRVWIDGLYEDYFMSAVGNDFKKLTVFKWLFKDLDTKIEQDKLKTPETFKFYGNKNDTPQGMEFGGGSNSQLPSRLQWANNAVTKYYQWKSNVKRDKESIAKSILKYVEASKERMSANPDLNTRIAYEYVLIGRELANGFAHVQGKTPAMDNVLAKIEQQRLAIVNHVRAKLTGKYHENNLQQVVAFSQKQVLGKEAEADITTELIPGKFRHIVAYAVEPQNRFGAKSSMSTGGRETQPGIFITYNNSPDFLVTQRIYCNTEMFNTMKDKFFVEFEWFPDINKINYASHLNYMPIMHLGQYFLNLANGKYGISFMFGEDIHTDIGARGSFTLVINDEIKANLKDYLDKLWAKKLESVTFNSQYGSKDQRNIITNWEELKKYGYPEKVTVERTGKVMKPWPRENEVESYVGSGWGLFKRDDGKYEVIGLGFVNKPGDDKWKWTSIASDMDYYILTETGSGDTKRIKPKRLDQGYEILPANIQKSNVW